MSHRFGHEELGLILDVLLSENISPYFNNPAGGKYVQELEKEFSEYIGVDYAIAVSNGTSALHTAYLACGIRPGARVYVPAHSFIATASMVLAVGATPVFADVDLETYCLQDPNGRLSNDPSRRLLAEDAIVPVDLLGHPCDMKPIYEWAKSRAFPMIVIEDAAQALGSMRNGKRVGSEYNDCATWSGQFTKSWTCGEGGMITTNDPKIAEKCKSIRSHGSGYLNSPYLTFNFRMTELHAAIGLAQLRKYPKILAEQRKNAGYILDMLPKGLHAPPNPVGPFEDTIFHNRYILGCRADPEFDREKFVAAMTEKGISKGQPGDVVSLGYTQPLWKKPLFDGTNSIVPPTPNAEQLCNEWVWLDVHRFKSFNEATEVAKAIRNWQE